ncbi:sideroflexin-1-like [Dysidea avara]|uniref:sideroflexin-1-like n=1 Tax=Dysidea avara TaxID=196820 RepID=UPI003321DCE4
MSNSDGRTLVSQAPIIDLSKPRYDQSTYIGRASHFFEVTDPRNVLLSAKQLHKAKELLALYKEGRAPANTTVDDIWKAKRQYSSAFHPDTGELMFLPGRMSFQVPGNMVITGLMMTFYRAPSAVIFWQWMNQSFNAGVNYTNRSGEAISVRNLAIPYVCATGGAVTSALAMNRMSKYVPSLIGRYVPYFAVAIANCINIPMIRQKEIREGIDIKDSEGNELGKSKVAAKKAISQVVLSRIAMAGPSMMLTPVIMEVLEKKTTILKRWPVFNAPIQIFFVGFFLAFATPMCCAIFPQQSSISVSKLEKEVQSTIPSDVRTVYFNKGL